MGKIGVLVVVVVVVFFFFMAIMAGFVPLSEGARITNKSPDDGNNNVKLPLLSPHQDSSMLLQQDFALHTSSRTHSSQQQRRRRLVFSSLMEFLLEFLKIFMGWLGLGGTNHDNTTDEDPLPAHPDDQYTPNPADWSTFYDKVDAAPGVLDHSPDGVTWINDAAWTKWDGIPIDPESMTGPEFVKTICPTSDTILGLRDLYYTKNPFADPKRPTKAEVDAWHADALTHLRLLVGIDHPAQPDHCLFARALWAQEMKHTDQWDSKYPDAVCDGIVDAHCGATFVPNVEDQVAYLPDSGNPASCTLVPGSEGVSSAAKSDIPWSVKWVRVFCAFLASEGYNGGHVGPFFRRQKFGWTFYDLDPSKANSNAEFRGKWGGELISPPWAVPKNYVEEYWVA